ncbi:MAG: nucleoside deaminase [Parvularculaceae bacterium]
MRSPPAKSFELRLPQWASDYAAGATAAADLAARMRFVIEAARLNVERGTGGPFGAAVFERETGALVSLGVNLVTSERISILHAEIVALALAQKRLGAFDLGAPGFAAHELVSSAEPCAMCLGAIPWSGVKRLVCGARGEDVESAGFDEGAKPGDWRGELSRRGVDVVVDLERAAASSVIGDYARLGGVIYNSAKSSD